MAWRHYMLWGQGRGWMGHGSFVEDVEPQPAGLVLVLECGSAERKGVPRSGM